MLGQHLAGTLGQLLVGDHLIDRIPAHHVEGPHLAIFGRIADEDAARRRLHHGSLHRHLLLARGGDPLPVPGGGGQEGDVQVEVAQEVGGGLPGTGLVLANDLAPGVIEAAAAVLDEVGAHHEVVGHYHQVFPQGQLPGQLQGGGAGIQIDGTPLAHLGGGEPGDGQLGPLHQAALGGVGGLALDPLGEADPARDGQNPPLLLQLLDVTPDGHVGDLQPVGQLHYADHAALGEQLQDTLLSLYGNHLASHLGERKAPFYPSEMVKNDK